MKLDSEQLAIIRLHVLHPHAVLPEVLAYDISLLIAELDSREQSRALQLSADSLRDVAGPISPHVSTRCVEPAPPIPPPEYERLGNEIIRLTAIIDRQNRELAALTPKPTPTPTETEVYRNRAITLLLAEMDRQDAKWGPLRKQHPFKWNTIAMEELGEAGEASLIEEGGGEPRPGHSWMDEMTQLAAVATQAMMARLYSWDSASRIFRANDHGSVDVP